MDRKWWTLAAVCAATFMLLLDVTIVNVALPDIQRALHTSFDDLQWVVDAYALTLASLLLTAGVLADLLGRRIVFAVGLVLFTLASLGCGLAQSPLELILFRGAQGIGGAIMFATSLALLAHAFRGRERGTAFGVWGAITGIAVAVGPVVGGALTTGLSWRWIFLVNLPVGVIALAMTLLRVDESRQREGRRLDYAGFVLFTASLGSLVYALIKSEDKGWGSTLIVSLLAASVVLMVLFVVVERVQRTPMVDLSLLAKPTFSGGSAAAFCLSAGLFAMLLYLTLYLQNVLRLSAMQTGLRLLVLSGGILVTATISGRLSSRIPIRFLIGPGLGLVGLGLLLMRGISPGDDWTHLIPGFICAGIGTGMINPPLASTAVGVVPPEQAGMASGINSTFRQVGIATGIGALGAIFQHNLAHGATAALGRLPGLNGDQAGAVTAALSKGDTASAIASAPAGARTAVTRVTGAAFVSALNDILLVGAITAFAGAVLALLLIRQKDFAEGSQAARRPEEAPPAPALDAAPAEETVPAPEEVPAAAGDGHPPTPTLDDLTRRVQEVILDGERAADGARDRVEQTLAHHAEETRAPLAELEVRRVRLTVLLAEQLRVAERANADAEATR
ncbi:MAG TPA: MFS transporter, partial [Solirubrobacteraceae bacterium]